MYGDRSALLCPGAVLNEEKSSVPVPRFPKNAQGHTMCWRLAVSDWRPAVDGGWWQLMVVGGSWWLGIGG